MSTVTITTSAVHGLHIGDVVFFEDIKWVLTSAGIQPDQLNESSWCVATVPSTTTFTIIMSEIANRVVYFDGDNDSLRLYEFNTKTGTWAQIGDSLSVTASGSNTTALAGLSATTWDADFDLGRVALVDSVNDEIRTYDFGGTDFVQFGSSFSLTGNHVQPALAALSATRIVYLEGGTVEELTTYDLNITTGVWTKVGNALSVAGIAGPALATMVRTKDAERIAYIDDEDDVLRAYDFDGTDWTTQGNDFALTCTSPALAGLSTTRVAFCDEANDELRTYDFDGTDWTLTGSGFSITDLNDPALAAMSKNRVTLCDTGSGANVIALRTYDFDGSVWALVGNKFDTGLDLSGSNDVSITSHFELGADPVAGSWTAYSSSGFFNKRVTGLTGLDHLEGEGVVGINDGIPFTGKTVSSNTIVLESFKAQVGLEFSHRFKSLKQNVGAPSGVGMGKKKRIGEMTVALLWAAEFSYGDDLLDTLFDSSNPATNVFTGERRLKMDSGWGSDERYTLKGSKPLPWFCMAVLPEIWTNDLL